MTLPGVGGLREYGTDVDLPLLPPIEPMLAKAQAKVPPEPGVWSYEPNGTASVRWCSATAPRSCCCRAVARTSVDLPELLDSIRGELAPARAGRGDRRAQGDRRAHPAGLRSRSRSASSVPAFASRIKMLAEETPAHFIGFRRAGHRRHVAAERAVPDASRSAVGCGERQGVVPRHPHHRGPRAGCAVADTFEGAGLDGVIAKRLDGPYLPGKREMVKVKHARARRAAWPSGTGFTSGRGRRVDPARPAPRRWRPDGPRAQRRSHRKDRIKELLADLQAAARGRRSRRRCAEPVELRGGQAVDSGPAGEGVRGRLRPRWRETRCTANGLGTR